MDSNLPADLRQGLDRLAEGRSRQELAARAAALSELYRAGGRSADAIRGSADALAYALARMPATYAATAAALAELATALPGFSPATLLDVGAGPGTATWAAMATFDAPAAIYLIDDSPQLRALALRLLDGSESPALREAIYREGELTDELRDAPAADLVIASYVLGELPPDALSSVADALWGVTARVLVVIEPGAPAGFARVRDLRSRLIANGAHVAAPCPHDGACPIVAPDWCHFSQRLARTRDHRQVKGATLSYEDEKFAYVALTREAVRPGDARVLAHPRITKGEASAKLCTSEGITQHVAARRNRDNYRAIKGWSWGDAVTRPEPPTE
jgi:ribosomal protein RSM22 (predicted rRNA methylase)